MRVLYLHVRRNKKRRRNNDYMQMQTSHYCIFSIMSFGTSFKMTTLSKELILQLILNYILQSEIATKGITTTSMNQQ